MTFNDWLDCTGPLALLLLLAYPFGMATLGDVIGRALVWLWRNTQPSYE